MLKNRPRLVLFDSLGHHVNDVVHNGCPQLQVEMRLDPLLGHCFGHALGMSPLELSRKQIT